jgi:hypothetical protein
MEKTDIYATPEPNYRQWTINNCLKLLDIDRQKSEFAPSLMAKLNAAYNTMDSSEEEVLMRMWNFNEAKDRRLKAWFRIILDAMIIDAVTDFFDTRPDFKFEGAVIDRREWEMWKIYTGLIRAYKSRAANGEIVGRGYENPY